MLQKQLVHCCTVWPHGPSLSSRLSVQSHPQRQRPASLAAHRPSAPPHPSPSPQAARCRAFAETLSIVAGASGLDVFLYSAYHARAAPPLAPQALAPDCFRRPALAGPGGAPIPCYMQRRMRLEPGMANGIVLDGPAPRARRPPPRPPGPLFKAGTLHLLRVSPPSPRPPPWPQTRRGRPRRR